MLNQEVKQRFLKTYYQNKSTRESAYFILWRAGKYEEKIGKDLNEMTFEEAQSALDEIGGTKVSSRTSKLSVIRTYIRWCEANGLKTTDAFFRVSTPSLDKIRNTMVSSPLDLAMLLDQYFGTVPEDEQNDNIVRCILWLAYMGVQPEDAHLLTADNVDLQHMELLYNGARLPIYRESYVVFRNVVTLDSFVYDNPNYNEGLIRRPRKPGNSILRGVRGTFDSPKSVMKAVTNATSAAQKNGVDRRIGYMTAMDSGIFYRAYELERVGLEPGLFDVAEEGVRRRIREGKKEDRSEPEIIRVANKRMQELVLDYKQWKLAFDRL